MPQFWVVSFSWSVSSLIVLSFRPLWVSVQKEHRASSCICFHDLCHEDRVRICRYHLLSYNATDKVVYTDSETPLALAEETLKISDMSFKFTYCF